MVFIIKLTLIELRITSQFKTNKLHTPPGMFHFPF